MRSQLLGISDHGRRGRREFPMLPSGVVNRKGKFSANCNKTTQDVSSGNGAQVPGIHKKKDGLKCNLYPLAFVGHDFKTLLM